MASENSTVANLSSEISPSSHPTVSPEEVYTNIPLEEGHGGDGKRKKQKVPRRILHFSDGTLEEYSTDEDEDEQLPPPVDPKTLNWFPWMWYYVVTASFRALSYADFCGEKLAWFFGITTPKYQAAIDEYYKMKAEEDEDKFEENLEKEAERLRESHKISTMEGGISNEQHVSPATVPPVAVVSVDREKF